MISVPGDRRVTGAAARGRLRASHADREQVIEVLEAAFVQGRLTRDELDERAGLALTARTHAELAAVTADLPAGIAEAPPARARSRTPGNTAVRTGARVIVAATVPTVALWAGAWLAGAGYEMAVLLVAVTFVWAGIVILTGAVMWQEHLQERSGRPPLSAEPAATCTGRR